MLSFIGQSFRPKFYQTGEFVYRQGDEIASFEIVRRGIGAFVQPKYHNQMFAIIHPALYEEYQRTE